MLTTQAQDNRPEVSIGADVVSRYVWRGLDLGHVSIQPQLAVDYRGLSLSAFANAGVSDKNDPQELDLTLSYTVGGLTLGITDYWSVSGDEQARYFNYGAHSTLHEFEGSIAYDFGALALSWNTFFAGYDGENKSGRRAYSSYVELTAPFRLADCECTATAGLVPYATTYYETNGFEVINLSLRVTYALPLGNRLNLPIFGEIIANPSAGKSWLVFGITIAK